MCGAAIYILLNLQHIKRNAFRWLVLGVFLSILYDLMWLFAQSTAADKFGAPSTYSLFMTTCSFLVRLVMALVYWKDSLDFDSIMMGKRVDQAILIRTVTLQA